MSDSGLGLAKWVGFVVIVVSLTKAVDSKMIFLLCFFFLFLKSIEWLLLFFLRLLLSALHG